MQLWKHIKAYLVLTRSDRLGVIAVVVMVAVITVLPFVTAPRHQAFPAKEIKLLVQEMDTISTADSVLQEAEYSAGLRDRTATEPAFVEGELFPFDPNTLPAEGWQRLGLNSRTSKTVVNYVSKGGRFFKAEDIKKIWGMPEAFYERVKDYVNIKAARKKDRSSEQQKANSEPPGKALLLVNINEAGADEFMALPGIGNVLASRIVKFRKNLGGFYSVEQVAQVYGLPDSTFQKIKGRMHTTGIVKKINLNTATKDQLKSHPYISWNLANAIVEYRNQHGAFKRLEELKNIVVMDEETFGKMVPYLSL